MSSALAISELKQVITKIVPLIVGKGMKVTQRGTTASVAIDPITHKPLSVNIPNMSDNASAEFISSVGGFIDHECAHILYTDFSVYCGSIEKGSSENTMLAQFHNIVEDTMIERRIIEDLPGTKRNLSEMRKSFLAKSTKKALATAKTDKEAFRYVIVPMMRALAGHTEMQDFMDDGKHWDNPYVKEFVDKLSDNAKDLLLNSRTTKETLIVAEEMVKIIENDAPQGNGEGEGEPSPSSSGSGSGESKKTKSSSEPKSDPSDKGEASDGDEKSEDGKKSDSKSPGKSEDKSEDEADEEGEDSGSSDKKGEDKDDETGASGKGEDKGDDESEETANKDDDDTDEEGDEEGDGTRGATDGEAGGTSDFFNQEADEKEGDSSGVGSGATTTSIFDFEEDFFEGVDFAEQLANEIEKEAVESMQLSEYNVYTTDFDQVEHLKVPNTFLAKSGVLIAQMEEETMSMTGSMQKNIERMLAARSYSVRVPGFRRGKLHTASLHRVMQGDARVFTQKQEKMDVDTAVSLVIDCSGSMRGEKIHTAMLATYALARTLDRVNISHELIGFTTKGFSNSIPHSVLDAMYTEARKHGIQYDRDYPLAMPIFKSFDDKLDVKVKQRIAYTMNAQQGLYGNVDGESIRVAANRLHTRREKRKVMIVLSDGQPAGSHRSGAHLKATVEKLKEEGIETIGIGIMDVAVRAYYENHTVLNKIEDLPGQVMNELKKILI